MKTLVALLSGAQLLCALAPSALAQESGPPPPARATANMRALMLLVAPAAEQSAASQDCRKGEHDRDRLCLPANARNTWVESFRAALASAGFQTTSNRLAPYDIELVPKLLVARFGSSGAEQPFRGTTPPEDETVFVYRTGFVGPRVTEGLRKNDSGGWKKLRQVASPSKAQDAWASVQRSCTAGARGGNHGYVTATTADVGFVPHEVASWTVSELATCDALESLASQLNQAAPPAAQTPEAATVARPPAAIPPPTPTAHKLAGKLAVLELRNFAKELSPENARYFTDLVRQTALSNQPQLDVMTRENLVVMLQASGKDLSQCEGECEVDTGRRIGADLIVSGEMQKLGTRYKLTLRLHDTHQGKLLGSRIASGTSIDDLDTAATKAAEELFKQ